MSSPRETASFEARRLRVRTESPLCSLAQRRIMDRFLCGFYSNRQRPSCLVQRNSSCQERTGMFEQGNPARILALVNSVASEVIVQPSQVARSVNKFCSEVV